MTLSEAIFLVDDMQRWRRGLPPYDWGQEELVDLRFGPEKYGEAIDMLLYLSRQIEKGDL